MQPFQFGQTLGQYIKQAADPSFSASRMAGLGGAGGVAAGAVSGLLAPGEYEDEDGNVKRRSRLAAALQRALALGAVGAAGGGAYGLYNPQAPEQAKELVMGGAKKLVQAIGGDKATTKNSRPPVDYGKMLTETPRGDMLFNLDTDTGWSAQKGLDNFMPIR